jgi:GPH family glycoside/pentoside/hexuronide:cation symporter
VRLRAEGDPMTVSSGDRLSIKEKVGYAVGDTASNLYFQTFLYFILFYYTDVVGLPAGAVATMFAVSRVWDAFNDPVMGTIADRTNTRWGKYRPYLLVMAVPFAVAGLLAFTTPDSDVTGKLIYAYITYNVLMMAYTAINVPYAALMGVITPNSLERTSLAAYRFVGVFIAALIVQGLALQLVRYFGQGDQARGWQMTMATMGALAIALFVTTFATTRERVTPPPGHKTDVRRDLRALFTNRPWLLIGGATVFQLAFIVVRGSSVAYYFKYYVGAQELRLFGSSMAFSMEGLTSAFLVSGGIVTIGSTMLTPWFAQWFGKGRAYVGFLLLSVVSQALFFVVAPEHVLTMFVLNILVSFAWGPVSALQWAMYTDAADHLEWTTGRRVTALLMAASLFALKIGLAFGGAFVGWMLEYHGFVANVDQTPDTLTGIRLLMSVYPACFGIVGVALMVFYPLNNRLMSQIEQDLKSKRAVAQGAAE